RSTTTSWQRRPACTPSTFAFTRTQPLAGVPRTVMVACVTGSVPGYTWLAGALADGVGGAPTTAGAVRGPSTTPPPGVAATRAPSAALPASTPFIARNA